MAKVLTAMGWAAAHLGETKLARQYGEGALALTHTIGNQKRRADALWLLGTLAIPSGDIEQASQLLGESLHIREKLGDHITDIASGSLDLGMTLTWIGRLAESIAVREETLAFYEAQGLQEQIALAHVRLAFSLIHVGQFDSAQYHATTGLALCRGLGNQRGAGLALYVLGFSAIAEEKNELADQFIQASLNSFREVEGATEIGWSLGLLAMVAYRQGKPEWRRSICQLPCAQHLVCWE